MDRELLGIHHVTAIADDPQRNIDFYTGVLGLRLVKATVNFEDPGTYHLFYGDYAGTPGSILSFFPWPGMDRGRKGTSQATLVSFAIPMEGLRYWGERLEDYNVPYEGPIPRFQDRVITFFDPDDLQIELVGQRGLLDELPQRTGPVPPQYALRRLCGVTCAVEDLEPTASILTGALGFRYQDEQRNRYRYVTGYGTEEAFVDLLVMPGMSTGRVAVGSVHHVAWRVRDEDVLETWKQRLEQHGCYPSPIADRHYYRSVHFREPGGILIEIATDQPGFTADETVDSLGTRLMLPPWLEDRRAELERFLMPLRLPEPTLVC